MVDTKEYTLLEVIFKMKLSSKKLVFSRVGDEKFRIFKGEYGDLMYKVGKYVRPLPIFNYMQDMWVEIDE